MAQFYNGLFLILLSILSILLKWTDASISSDPVNEIRQLAGEETPSFVTDEDDMKVKFVPLDSNFGENAEKFQEDYEEEEQDCPDGQYLHVRGRICVPTRCVGGNRYRDVETGKCLIQRPYDFGNGGISQSFGRYNPRTQSKASKGRLRFGLPTKVKG